MIDRWQLIARGPAAGRRKTSIGKMILGSNLIDGIKKEP